MNAQLGDIESWDEVRTAYHVARLGTVSAAAEHLGVHHATVIRHIDALEARLGAKLFQRHARGYTPTEPGRDLLKVAAATDDLMAQFSGRVKGCGAVVGGELVVTSVTSAARLLIPVFDAFRGQHPDIRFRLISDNRYLRLEYGEAHIALRAGKAPQEPDNVAQKLGELTFGLFAHRSYVQRRGLPKTVAQFKDFEFVGPATSTGVRAPYNLWLVDQVPAERVVMRSNDPDAGILAVRSGMGIGFMPRTEAATDDALVEVMPPLDDWHAPLWLVTHVDLHRTAKVQAFSTFLKREAAKWAL